MNIVRILIAIFIPPLAVFLTVGIGKEFWISLILTILGFIPGLVYAVWTVAKKSS